MGSLRGGVDDYLGGVDLRDKRVLEVGTASKQMLGVLGFEKTAVRYHVQRFGGKRKPLFTVVAGRTKPVPT